MYNNKTFAVDVTDVVVVVVVVVVAAAVAVVVVATVLFFTGKTFCFNWLNGRRENLQLIMKKKFPSLQYQSFPQLTGSQSYKRNLVLKKTILVLISLKVRYFNIYDDNTVAVSAV